MKWPFKVLQNLPYFLEYEKPWFFINFQFVLLYFSLMNSEYPGLCRQLDIDHGHSLGENKVQSMKWKSKKTSTITVSHYAVICTTKIWLILKQVIKSKHKPLISEVWVLNAHYINSSSESGARIFSAPEKKNRFLK